MATMTILLLFEDPEGRNEVQRDSQVPLSLPGLNEAAG